VVTGVWELYQNQALWFVVTEKLLYIFKLKGASLRGIIFAQIPQIRTFVMVCPRPQVYDNRQCSRSAEKHGVVYQFNKQKQNSLGNPQESSKQKLQGTSDLSL